MKKITFLYENTKEAIKITYFAFALIAFGFLIQNKAVNIFYTFTNPFFLKFADGCLKCGQLIVTNLPIIFMTNYVCKKNNSHLPIVLAFVGYFAYFVSMSLLCNQSFPAYVYNKTFSGMFEYLGINKIYETGMVGAMLVGFLTRYSFIHSRHRSNFAILGFLDKDLAAIIYNIIYCSILGVLMSFIMPLVINVVFNFSSIIADDLSNSRNIGFYGVLDRVLSIFGMNNLIRYPFWFSSAGGSYTNQAGKIIVGDVNIWNYIAEAAETYSGAGRFITGYYVINIFMVPALYLGMWFSLKDKKKKAKYLLPLIFLGLLSIVCGNPLAVEITLLFTSPLLLGFYLALTGFVFFYLSNISVYLGYSATSTDVICAMPGNFPDYIIDMRNALFSNSISTIFLVGIIAAIIMFAFVVIYYNFLSYDLAHSGKTSKISRKIIDAVGGKNNITNVTCDTLNIEIDLDNHDLVSYESLKQINTKSIYESKNGIVIELGSSSLKITKAIEKALLKDQ